MRKALIIAPVPPPYHGAATATQGLIDGLLDTYSIRLINTNPNRLVAHWRFDVGRFFQSFAYYRSLIGQLTRFKPDIAYIVLSQTAMGFIKDSLFIIAAKLFSRKCVVHLHGSLLPLTYSKGNLLLRFYIRQILAATDAIIALTETAKTSLAPLVTEQNKIRIIENCVPADFLAHIQNSASIDNTNKTKAEATFNVLYLSNLIRSKGYFDVLQAAREMKDEANVRFIFIGAWESEEEKKQALAFVADHHLEERVKFAGIIAGQEKTNMLLRSHAFILPTYYPQEGMPIAILEAMACGLPIITTRHNGIPCVVVEPENGFFVPAQNHDAIKEKIKQLIDNEALRFQIGKNNKQKVRDFYAPQIFNQKIIQLFDSLTDNST